MRVVRFATIALFALIAGRVPTRADDSNIAFEAVSIKPFPEVASIMMSGCMGGPGSDDPGRINCEYTTVKMLLARAYKVKSQEIFGPGWLDSAHFNIVAKLPQGANQEQVPAMFRNLLAERFKVALHGEKRLLPGYAVTVGKSGIKMKETAPEPAAANLDAQPAGGKLPIGADGFPVLRPAAIASGPIILYRQGRARLQAGNTSLATFAEALSRQLDRVVADETGLIGKYDITLYWTPDAIEPGGRPRPAVDAGPESSASEEAAAPDLSLFAAVEQQLGLKLESKKIERDTLVIDRAEKIPVEN